MISGCVWGDLFFISEKLPGSTLGGTSGRADSVAGEAIIDNLDTCVDAGFYGGRI